MQDFIERKAMQIDSDVRHHTLPMLEQILRLEILINLTSYGATGSNPRDSTIKEAFDIMASLVGFQYNQKGSFLWDGAVKAFERDVKLIKGENRLVVDVDGHLEDLEHGYTDWNSLRRFFYSKKLKRKIQHDYPQKWRGFYDRLDALFKYKSDPTMPQGRPYITSALSHGTEWMHERMKTTIHQAFDNNGRWYKGGGNR